MKKGKLITFEGCEGVGKSTQVRLLKEYLERTGQSAMFLREPGGTRISEQIRGVILSAENSEMTDECEVLLYSAARAQLVAEVISPALERGETVVCDRYVDSTLAYQGYARGLGFDFVRKLNRFVCGEALPDVTIFLDLDPALAFKRKGGADSSDRLETEKIDFHRDVYEGYKLAASDDAERFVTIVPSGSKWDTHNEVVSQLRKKGIIR